MYCMRRNLKWEDMAVVQEVGDVAAEAAVQEVLAVHAVVVLEQECQINHL